MFLPNIYLFLTYISYKFILMCNDQNILGIYNNIYIYTRFLWQVGILLKNSIGYYSIYIIGESCWFTCIKSVSEPLKRLVTLIILWFDSSTNTSNFSELWIIIFANLKWTWLYQVRAMFSAFLKTTKTCREKHFWHRLFIYMSLISSPTRSWGNRLQILCFSI